MAIEISATSRATQGKGASRRLRHTGRVPAVLYGGGKDAENIELDHKEIAFKLKQEAFHASILTLDLSGEKQRVLLRDVQMHPWRAQVLHVDFQRVAKDRKIHMKVPLHFVNEVSAPGVKTGGGIISHVQTELDISCLPDDLPEFIEVDLGELQLGSSVHLSDLKLPEGVDSTRLGKGDDAVVATVQVPRAEVEKEVEPEAVAAVAPVVPAAEEKKSDKKEGDKK